LTSEGKPMRDEPRWRTVCVSYFDDPDALILDAVRPLFDSLADEVDAAYFLRHWRRGPHVRLNIRTTAGRMRRTVLPAVAETVGHHLRDHPSTSALDLSALLPTYRRLAEAELDQRPLWPPRPDNSIAVEPYDSRADVLGGPAAARLVAAFYVAANAPAFETMAAAQAEQQRLWTAFELMVATAHAFSGGGVRLGFVSLRAHADTFLARAADQRRVRAAWDQLYQAARPALTARLRKVVTALDTAVGAPPHVSGTIEALEAVKEQGLALVDAGALTMDHPSRPSKGSTPFLRDLLASDDFRDHMKPSPAFRRYRLMLNLLYLQLTRIGVRASERYLLGHLAANTVEEAYGVDAATLMRQQSAAMAAAS
jgi:hypothetical protein